MAVTLTEPAVADGTVHVSFPILKWEQDEDGDLVVKGVATDGTLDSDEQVVSPEWSAKALDAWISTGGNVRMSHDARRPVGKGLQVEVNKDGTGKHWVTSVIVDRDAQKLIKKGVLTAYSVGIARPVIKHDPTGKARGGIIVGGELCELSVVDRPSNKNSYLEIAKAAADGTCEFTGKVFGADAADDTVNVDLPKGASISISPADFAKLRTFKQELVTKTAGATLEAETEKRDIGAADRRRLAAEGNAVRNDDGHISYPIENAGDLENAAHLARTGHGDTAAARRLIARRAEELGVANPLDESDEASKSATIEAPDAALKEAEPDVTKDPEDEDKGKPVKKAKKKKKLPPWLNKPSGDDDAKGGDSDGDGDSCKTAHSWILTGDGAIPDVRCEKCHTTPAEAAGLSGTHDMTCAPVPELLETPLPMSAKDAGPADEAKPAVPDAGMMKTSPEVAAILRFKAAGIDIELGRLHDMTCPAFHPEDVAKCHPFSDLARIDVDAFQREAVKAACGPDMDRAKSLNLAWQAAHTLKAADPAQVNDFRMEAHKAFRDANPGPTSALTPGMVTPGKFNRPLITAGHEAASTGHDGPNSSPPVATSAPNAHSFDRPPLSAGHQSPSPSHMKGGLGEYPSLQGTPTQLNYAVMEKERARHALMQMHEHLSRQFPEACPIDLDRPVMQPERHPVPAAVGKSALPSRLDPDTGEVYKGFPLAAPAPVAAPGPEAVTKAPEDLGEWADEAVYKGFKKARKKLGKKVLSGSMTVDEARAKLGRQFAQKAQDDLVALGVEQVQKGIASIDEVRGRLGLPPFGTPESGAVPAPIPGGPAPVAPAVAKAIDPEVIKAAAPRGSTVLDQYGNLLPPRYVAASLDPEAIKAAVAEATSELKELLVKQQETFTTKLAEQQKVIDAIADQPDPSTAAFSGLAFNPLRTKAARPAGVAETAEIAERTQNMVIRELQSKYNSSSDPHEREAYYTTLCKMRGYSEP